MVGTVSSSSRLVLRDVPLDAALFVPALSANNKSCQAQIKQNQRKTAAFFGNEIKSSRKKRNIPKWIYITDRIFLKPQLAKAGKITKVHKSINRINRKH
jgi:hypothetical protein